jgi:hypothetical protein
MVGSLAHRLPLVMGHSGYPPLHRGVLLETMRRFPSPDALDELVDLTHVRWLLLRPADYWSDASAPARVLALPGVERVLERDGWVLARVGRPMRRREWYEAIAAGYRPGRTVLGTPLVPLADGEAVGVVEAAQPPPDVARAGTVVLLDVRIRNGGPRPWPVVVPPSAPTAHTVRALARWTRVGGGRAEPAPSVEPVRLRRDVPAGDMLGQVIPVRTPGEPGTYDLVVGLEQEGGATFAAAGNVPLRARLTVTGAGD